MKYFRPETIEETMQLLSKGGGRIIAGGTDLVLDLKSKKVIPDALIDISRIPQLQTICRDEDRIIIGGAVTHTDAANSTLLLEHAPALAAGCHSVGSRQIRNVATLAGNIVNAQPAADSAVPLAVMNPVFHIQTLDGIRTASMAEMYAGFGKSTLDSSRELLTAITLEAEDENEASAYERLELRGALALPMLCVAVRVRLSNNNTIEWAKIAMAPVGIGPVRATEAEAFLSGKTPDKSTLHTAGKKALENANPRSNLLRGSREYRVETLPVLVRRALEKACTAVERRREGGTGK